MLLYPKRKLLKSSRTTIQFLVDEKIIDAEVSKRGLSLSSTALQKEIKKIAKQNNFSVQQLKKTLSKEGVSFSEYKKFLKKSLERRSLIQNEVSSKIHISKKDIDILLKKKKLGKPLYTKRYEVLYAVFQEGGLKKARQSALKAASGFDFDDDFREFSKEFSEDSDVRKNPLLGNFQPHELSPLFRRTVLKTPLKTISAPVIVGHQIYLLYKNSEEEVPNKALKKHFDLAQNLLFERKFKSKLKTWLSEKRKKSYIKIK